MSHHSQLPTSHSAYSMAASSPTRRMPQSSSAVSLAFPQSTTLNRMTGPGHGTQMRSSRTWTSSSGEFGVLSDTDEVDNREVFIVEYNRLANKHGIRLFFVDDFCTQPHDDTLAIPGKRGWFSRMLRSTSNNSPPPLPNPAARPPTRHKRSVSDLALKVAHARREAPKIIDLQTMVRVSGKGLLYLPPDYAPCALVLPTCLRALAQHLAQNVTTRGIFRIPGSVKIVNALFDYYCYTTEDGAEISSTVRCANLPMHIRSSVHDIASTFKRLLSVLSGGILGSLAIFDALVAIHSQLRGDPEFPRTKQTKVRARLIALAFGTIRSQFRRELICAVFGLLSLIGRVAEVTPREDEDRRPLPTGDLMGYNALGIVFGPLLVGDLLSQYAMKIATPNSGLLVFPLTPQRLRRERHKPKGAEVKPLADSSMNKVLIANQIAEMLLINWRDIVRQMKALGVHHRKATPSVHTRSESVRPTSEDFVVKRPRDWDQMKTTGSGDYTGRERSPEPATPTLGLRRQRPRSRKSVGSNKILSRPSIGALSPTEEESAVDDEPYQSGMSDYKQRTSLYERARKSSPAGLEGGADSNRPSFEHERMIESFKTDCEQSAQCTSQDGRERTGIQSPQVSLDDVPPRTSSKPRQHHFGGSAAHPVGVYSSGDDALHPTIRKRQSLESTRGRSREDSKRSVQDSAKRNHSARSPSWTRKSRSSSVRGHKASQASQLSFPSAQRAVEDKMTGSTPKPFTVSDSSEELAEDLTSLLDELDSENKPENGRLSGGALTVQSPRSHRDGSQHAYHEEDYFYQAQNGTTQSRLDSTIESSSRASHNITPIQFYSPMRVPPSLSGQVPDQHSGISPATRIISGDRTSKPSKGGINEPGDYALEQGQLRREKQQKRAGLLSQRLRQFNEPFGATLPRIRTSQNQSRGTAQSSSRERSFVRPSVSEAASKRGAVKAMAAKFEGGEDPSESFPVRPSIGRRDQSILSPYGSGQPPRSVRASRSGPLYEPRGAKAQSLSGSQPTPRKSVSGPSALDDAAMHTLRASVSDSAALYAASNIAAEKQKQGMSHDRPSAPVIMLRPPAQARKLNPEPQEEKHLRNPQSLGTMVPPREQPPIAQHLNMARPVSSSSFIATDADELSTLSQSTSTLIPRPGSTSSLHSQIRNLQRQLDSRTEEAASLRRQLAAQEDSDIGTLSEQLREAKREVMVWRDRADAAERRVKVFERFTARLRGIREAAAMVEQQSPEQPGDKDPEDELGDYSDVEDDVSPNQRVRFAGARRTVARTTEGGRSDDSGKTEDVGVITARIRKCLHGGPKQGRQAENSALTSARLGGDGATSPRPTRGVSQSSAVDIWMAAQELLDGEAC